MIWTHPITQATLTLLFFAVAAFDGAARSFRFFSPLLLFLTNVFMVVMSSVVLVVNFQVMDKWGVVYAAFGIAFGTAYGVVNFVRLVYEEAAAVRRRA